MQKLRNHPIATIFPMMPQLDLDALTDNIKTHGLRENIILLDNQILDGRNRYLACLAAGVEPKFKEYNGSGSPLEFVLSLNLHRRHLDESQRAMVMAKLATFKEGRPSKTSPIGEVKTQAQAAEMLNVGKRTVERVRQVLDHSTPELIAAVEQGKVAVSQAVKQIVKPEPPIIIPARSSFNSTNENIGWAAWSWNPVTGCKMGCECCYARDIGMRFSGHFRPTFHKDRLDAPKNTKPARLTWKVRTPDLRGRAVQL